MNVLCVFDKRRDVAQVQQHVAVDLAEAFKNKVVPSQVDDSELQYGNIESPLQIAGRPTDVFEAMQMNRSFAKTVADAKKGAEE